MGQYQADALQNVTGTLGFRRLSNGLSIFSVDESGAVYQALSSATATGRIDVATQASELLADVLRFDASRVARASTETRGASAAVAPYIHV